MKFNIFLLNLVLSIFWHIEIVIIRCNLSYIFIFRTFLNFTLFDSKFIRTLNITVDRIPIIRYLPYLLSIIQLIFIDFIEFSFRKNFYKCSILFFLIKMLGHIHALLIFLRKLSIFFL